SNKLLCDNLRLGYDRKQVFFERFCVGLLYEQRTHLSSDLFAEMSLKQRAGRLSCTKSFNPCRALESTIRFLNLLPHSFRGDLETEFLLDSVNWLNSNFKKKTRKNDKKSTKGPQREAWPRCSKRRASTARGGT